MVISNLPKQFIMHTNRHTTAPMAPYFTGIVSSLKWKCSHKTLSTENTMKYYYCWSKWTLLWQPFTIAMATTHNWLMALMRLKGHHGSRWGAFVDLLETLTEACLTKVSIYGSHTTTLNNQNPRMKAQVTLNNQSPWMKAQVTLGNQNPLMKAQVTLNNQSPRMKA